MSQSEYHTGKLVKAFQEPKSFEEGINILKEKYNIGDIDIEIEDKRVYSDIVHYINNEFYIIENHNEFEPDDMCDYTINPDGSIFFTVGFYNGGTCLSEVLSDIVYKVYKTTPSTVPSEINNDLQVGDIVVLKSGGPRMTVTAKDGIHSIECSWFTDNERFDSTIIRKSSVNKIKLKGNE